MLTIPSTIDFPSTNSIYKFQLTISERLSKRLCFRNAGRRGTSVSGLQSPAACGHQSLVPGVAQPSCFQDRVLGVALLHCHPVSLLVRACASKCQFPSMDEIWGLVLY
jgi:hypothetical protein